MKYAVIDDTAVDEIVANRFLQSTEFEQGRTLLAVLRGEVRAAKISASLRITHLGDGVFITGQTISQTAKYLVIDEEQSGLLALQSSADTRPSFRSTRGRAMKTSSLIEATAGILIASSANEACQRSCTEATEKCVSMGASRAARFADKGNC